MKIATSLADRARVVLTPRVASLWCMCSVVGLFLLGGTAPVVLAQQPCPPGGGPVEALSLQYIGDPPNPSFRFEVTAPAGNQQVLFNQSVQQGDQFTLVSTTPGGNIGDQVSIFVGGSATPFVQFDTSCQTPLNVGDIIGPIDLFFEVIDIASDLECSPLNGGLIDVTIDVDADGDGNGSPEINDVLGFSLDVVNNGGNASSGIATLYYPTSRFAYVSGGDSNAGSSAKCATPGDCGEVSFNFTNLASGGTQSFGAQLQALVGTSNGIPTTVAAEISFDTITDTDSAPNNLSITVDASGNISPALSEDDECFNAFTLLPVELTTFEAILDGRAAALRWETASETNNAGFEVHHRYVGDAEKTTSAFEVMGFVQGAGTTLETQAYTFRADALQPGRHLFRLKQIDFDGSFEFSPEVEVLVEMPDAFFLSDVYPNPFNPEARLDFAVKQSQHVSVSVYNLLGQQVLTLYDGTPAAGVSHSIVINGSGLQSGLYIVRVEGEQFVEARTVTLIK